MIIGRPLLTTAKLLVDAKQWEVIIRLNNQYQAYKVTPQKEEDYNCTNRFDVWFKFKELVERNVEVEIAA